MIARDERQVLLKAFKEGTPKDSKEEAGTEPKIAT